MLNASLTPVLEDAFKKLKTFIDKDNAAEFAKQLSQYVDVQTTQSPHARNQSRQTLASHGLLYALQKNKSSCALVLLKAISNDYLSADHIDIALICGNLSLEFWEKLTERNIFLKLMVPSKLKNNPLLCLNRDALEYVCLKMSDAAIAAFLHDAEEKVTVEQKQLPELPTCVLQKILQAFVNAMSNFSADLSQLASAYLINHANIEGKNLFCDVLQKRHKGAIAALARYDPIITPDQLKQLLSEYCRHQSEHLVDDDTLVQLLRSSRLQTAGTDTELAFALQTASEKNPTLFQALWQVCEVRNRLDAVLGYRQPTKRDLNAIEVIFNRGQWECVKRTLEKKGMMNKLAENQDWSLNYLVNSNNFLEFLLWMTEQTFNETAHRSLRDACKKQQGAWFKRIVELCQENSARIPKVRILYEHLSASDSNDGISLCKKLMSPAKSYSFFQSYHAVDDLRNFLDIPVDDFEEVTPPQELMLSDFERMEIPSLDPLLDR